MSSGFVSGGTSDQPVERDSDWAKAQQEIAVARRRKEDEGKQEGGKSLFEVLQTNKASKQEAFEESIRLKNQFRALEEDEVEFLDSVLESTRAKEAAVRKETSEQLEAFRKQREMADRDLLTQTQPAKDDSLNQSNTWTTNKKRRRDPVKESKESEETTATKRRKSHSDDTKDLKDLAVGGLPQSAIDASPKASIVHKTEFAGSIRDLPVATNHSANISPKAKGPIATLGLDSYTSSSEDD